MGVSKGIKEARSSSSGFCVAQEAKKQTKPSLTVLLWLREPVSPCKTNLWNTKRRGGKDTTVKIEDDAEFLL